MWVLDDTLFRQFILLTLFWALNFTDNRITLITDMDMTIKLVCYTNIFSSPHAIYDHFVIPIRYSAANTSEINIIGIYIDYWVTAFRDVFFQIIFIL